MSITKVGMPKFGLVMTEGTVAAWLVDEGAEVAPGDELAEIETDKINGAVEAPAPGVLRRRVAGIGDVLPIGALLGVIADSSVADAEIDAFVDEFQASFVPEGDDDERGPQTQSVTVAAGTIRYVREGDGERAIVLLHGFGADLSAWLFNTGTLAGPGRSVVVLDLPGHGGSTKDVGGGTLDELAATVREALDALGLDRIDLVGHSLGGAVAIAISAADPGRIVSLTLIAPAGLGPEIDGEFLDRFVAAESRRDLRPVLERLFADPAVVTRQFTEEVLKTKRIDGVDAALRAIAAANFPGGRQALDLADTLAGLPLPVLVIWGAQDGILPPAQAAAAPAGARVEVIEGAGHQPQMEAAGEVNRLLDELLESTAA